MASKFSKFLKKGKSVGVKASAATALEAATAGDVDAAAELLEQLKRKETVAEWGADESDEDAPIPPAPGGTSHFASLVESTHAVRKPRGWQSQQHQPTTVPGEAAPAAPLGVAAGVTKPQQVALATEPAAAADGVEKAAAASGAAESDGAAATPAVAAPLKPAQGEVAMEPIKLFSRVGRTSRVRHQAANVDVKNTQQFPELGAELKKPPANAWAVPSSSAAAAPPAKHEVAAPRTAAAPPSDTFQSKLKPSAAAVLLPDAVVSSAAQDKATDAVVAPPLEGVVTLERLLRGLRPVKTPFKYDSALSAQKYAKRVKV